MDGTVPARFSVRAKAALVLVWVLSFGSLSCGLAKRVNLMFGGELPVQVDIAPDANENSPIAVDLVLVYDSKVLEELLKLSAGAWFAKRDQFLADYGEALHSELREWVPGQPDPTLILTYHPGARRLVLFADYDTQGDHRATVDPQQPFRLVLGEKGFVVEELGGGRGGL